MIDICRYKNEPMAVMTKGMHAIGAYYPEKNAVVAWSLTMPVELLIEFAGVVAREDRSGSGSGQRDSLSSRLSWWHRDTGGSRHEGEGV